MSNVLMLLKTTGLEYDDRVRKECLSLMGLGARVCIGVLDDSNGSQSGETAYGAQFRSVSLILRKMFPGGRGLALKTAELYVRFICMIVKEKPDVLWIHDMPMGGLAPIGALLRRFGLLRRIVWDQHELPADGVLDSAKKMAVIGRLAARCDALVAANVQRRSLLQDRLAPGKLPQYEVLENFPDASFCQVPREQIPSGISPWLAGKPYLLSQGGGDPDRGLQPCVEAIIRIGTVKLVVVGRYLDSVRQQLEARWGKRIEEQVRFVGMVPQMELIHYIDHALASIILYQRVRTNSWLCAPNRLYQAVVRGVPVITGCNPGLAEFVASTGAGVAMATDGSDADDIGRAVREVMEHQDRFRKAARDCSYACRWESQRPTVARLLDAREPPDDEHA